MAHEGLTRFASVCVLALTACGGGAVTQPPPKPVTPPPPAFEDAPVAKFHSTRFAMNVPFVDGKAWTIDDRTTRELVALHAASHSEVHVALWTEQNLMNRARCELRATELGYMPDLELEVVDQEVTSIPAGWDTRVLVATEVPKANASPGTLAHVFAYASNIRKCIFFHFKTEARAGDERTLSSRLAVARLKMLEGISMDTFGVIPREKNP